MHCMGQSIITWPLLAVGEAGKTQVLAPASVGGRHKKWDVGLAIIQCLPSQRILQLQFW